MEALREAQEALRRSTAHAAEIGMRFRELLIKSPIAICVLREPGHRVELANPRFLEMVNKPELVGKTLAEAFPETVGTPLSELFNRVARTGEPFSIDEYETTLDRGGAIEPCFFTFNIVPIRESGEITRMMCTSVEITELVRARRASLESAERLRLALDAGQLGDWEIDLRTGVTNRSRRHDEVFGHSERLPGWTFDDFLRHVVPEDRADVEATFKAALATAGVWDFECGIRHRDGSARWIEGHGRVQVGMTGQPERMLGTVADITARKLAEQERKELLGRARAAQLEAERANLAKDEFLAVLGHELRNPLAPILTALELMRLRGDDTAEKERTVIERQARHLVGLVDDLLDVSRITSGKVELKKQRVELAEVIAKAIEMASPLLEQRRHILTVDVQAGLALEADAARLAQVISNLLTNAAKYTEPGGRIDITAARSGDEITLRVRDNGIGIAPEMLPRVFDMFMQEPQSLDRARGGLGLGLAIAKSLVNLHGGIIDAHSSGRGEGAEFIVKLLASRCDEASASRLAGAPPSAVATRKRILVVDDNEDAAEMMAAALELMGHTTRVAPDGPAALRLIDQFKPDVALLDLGLPVMDGYELARQLRSDERLAQLKLVAVTGYGQDADRRRSLAVGFDAHLVKPVHMQRIAALIEALTGGPTEADPSAPR
jgi:PAS domain S-box-containing protein